jgi:hypothetical protein
MLLLAHQFATRLEDTRRSLLEKSIGRRLRIANQCSFVAQHTRWGLSLGLERCFNNFTSTLQRVLPVVSRGEISVRSLLSFNIRTPAQLGDFWSPFPIMVEAENDIKVFLTRWKRIMGLELLTPTRSLMLPCRTWYLLTEITSHSKLVMVFFLLACNMAL